MRTARYDVFETALGPIVVAATPAGLAYVGLAQGDASELARWAARLGLRIERAADAVAMPARAIRSYAAGDRAPFELELDLRGTPFQVRVWRELAKIPYGETRTYGEIARALGQPGASRAVGAANGKNPVPLVVPCHRCVASDGLGGFGAGLGLKRRLLELESAGLFH
jgi:O-6-methylguanine DNA methyltransferase